MITVFSRLFQKFEKFSVLTIISSMKERICISYVGDRTPHYATEEACGADLYADIPTSFSLKSKETCMVPTGLKIAIPKGFEAQVRPRSGLAFQHGITVLNSPGTIDSDYRGEIKILLINLGKEDFVIEPGMRIAQLVIAPVVRAEFVKTEILDATVRNENGFGSTGKK